MAISMYTAAVPMFQTMLGNLSHILDKAQANAAARKIDEAAFTTFRLYPDMLPFTRQVLIACDTAKNGVARIGGVEPPKFEDKESTLAELKARIQKTLDFLATVKPEALEGTEQKDVTFPVGRDATRTMKAEDYLRQSVIPNFFFHISTAYAILRHNGVDLGKADYLRGAQG